MTPVAVIVETPPLHKMAVEVAVTLKGLIGFLTSVAVKKFHASPTDEPSPLVALQAALNVMVAVPVVGAVQLKVHEAVPLIGTLGTECSNSELVLPNCVPAIAVIVPAEALKSNPSLNPKGEDPVILVFVTDNVKE